MDKIQIPFHGSLEIQANYGMWSEARLVSIHGTCMHVEMDLLSRAHYDINATCFGMMGTASRMKWGKEGWKMAAWNIDNLVVRNLFVKVKTRVSNSWREIWIEEIFKELSERVLSMLKRQWERSSGGGGLEYIII